GVLDAVDVLERRQQAHHVGAPEDERLAVAPAGFGFRHRPILPYYSRLVAAVRVDRERSAARIESDIEHLAGAAYTRSTDAIRRYAYTPEYRNTLDWFAGELESIGFTVTEDAVGTMVARNRPPGEPAFGVGSHCDSNRNGGKYDARWALSRRSRC